MLQKPEVIFKSLSNHANTSVFVFLLSSSFYGACSCCGILIRSYYDQLDKILQLGNDMFINDDQTNDPTVSNSLFAFLIEKQNSFIIQ